VIARRCAAVRIVVEIICAVDVATAVEFAEPEGPVEGSRSGRYVSRDSICFP